MKTKTFSVMIADESPANLEGGEVVIKLCVCPNMHAQICIPMFLDDDVVLFRFRPGGIPLKDLCLFEEFQMFQLSACQAFLCRSAVDSKFGKKQPTKLDASKKRKEFLEAYVIHIHVVDCSIANSEYVVFLFVDWFCFL